MTYIRIAGVMALGAFTAIAIVVLSMLTTMAMFGLLLYSLSGPVLASTGPTAEMPCAAGIVDILKRSVTTMPFRMETKVSSSRYDAELTTDVVPHLGMSTVGTVNGTQTALVVFNDRGWMQVDGEWRAVTPDLARDLMGDIDPLAITLMGAPSEATCHGLETVANGDYLHFSFVYKADGIEARNEMLADAATLLPVKIETLLVDHGMVTETTIVTYEYDATITVVPPENVPIL